MTICHALPGLCAAVSCLWNRWRDHCDCHVYTTTEPTDLATAPVGHDAGRDLPAVTVRVFDDRHRTRRLPICSFPTATTSAKDRLLLSGKLGPMEGQDDFDAAQKLFDDQKYSAAEKAFKKVAKKYADKPIEEQTLFMLAESQFKQERFPKAQDSYNRLLSKYESSRYLDQSTHRLFDIARVWLDFPEPVKESEIRLATGGDDPNSPPVPLKKVKRPAPLLPNFTDDKRPMFDTDGRAMEALKSVWLNNPTGKLADDAVMMSGVYYLRKGDYLEAERYFDMLRQHYPDSNHAANAYKLGAHVIQVSYQGPHYDGRGLDKAKELTESLSSLYPDTEDQERIKKRLARIQHEKARKEWERVKYRLKRGEKRAAEINCSIVLQDYPDSAFAKMAQEQLEKLQAERNARLKPEPLEEQFQPGLPEYEATQEEEPGEFFLPNSVPFEEEEAGVYDIVEEPELLDTAPLNTP